MDIVKAIRDLHLHDIPVTSLKFGFPGNTITLRYERHNAIRNEYDKEQLYFTGVSEIKFENVSTFKLDEITDVNVEKRETGFWICIVFLMGFAMPSWTIEFHFEDVQMTNP